LSPPLGRAKSAVCVETDSESGVDRFHVRDDIDELVAGCRFAKVSAKAEAPKSFEKNVGYERPE
jgi:hypothetical protein